MSEYGRSDVTDPVSRRDAILGASLAAVGVATAGTEGLATGTTPNKPFGYCLNTSTIRGQRLGIVKEIEIAAETGYGAIEPWIGSIRKYQEGGGSLGDLAKKLADLGLSVPSAIGFAPWIVNDDARRARGLEQAKTDMDLVKQIGGTGVAAPPAGVKHGESVELLTAAERYRTLLEAGAEQGIVPQLELWGPSPVISRIGQAAMIAIESGHPNASLLLDAYHIYKGGSDFTGLKLLGPQSMHVFHMNDYPADPPRETIRDGDRVFPGDGVAPLSDILRTFRDIGFDGWLSLELFNKAYYARPALEVAKEGLAKMRAVVEQAK